MNAIYVLPADAILTIEHRCLMISRNTNRRAPVFLDCLNAEHAVRIPAGKNDARREFANVVCERAEENIDWVAFRGSQKQIAVWPQCIVKGGNDLTLHVGAKINQEVPTRD